MKPLRIAIVGFGKIAADQHVPAIAGHPRLELAATVSRSHAGPAPSFATVAELLASGIELDAVALTSPPSVRYDIARPCIEAGLHALLEKPPTVTLGEIEDLACLAESNGVSLFATWHAQENPAVAAAAEALAGQRIASMEIVWHEDVDKWHPGQRWIWEPGGFGVFDPGINAFSIATKIFPGELCVQSADLHFPRGADTPIAAEIAFKSSVADGPLRCSLDWRRSEGEEWTIAVRTANGRLVGLTNGGAQLAIDDADVPCAGPGEYPALYGRLVDLIDEQRTSVDVAPLRLVADCLLVGRRNETEPLP